jgi:hypothetical protein
MISLAMSVRKGRCLMILSPDTVLPVWLRFFLGSGPGWMFSFPNLSAVRFNGDTLKCFWEKFDAWNVSALGGSWSIQPSLSIKEKNSSSNGADCSVFLEPKMTSFDRARVKETFILLQSLTRSPICIPHQGLPSRIKETHLAVHIRSDHRNNDAILIPSLTPVSGQDLDTRPIL